MPALRPALAVGLPTKAARDADAWWHRAGAFADHASDHARYRLRYRFGDGLLDVSTGSRTLFAELEDRYGDCAIRSTEDRAGPCVQCSIHFVDHGRLARVRFGTGAAVDAFEVARALLEHPTVSPLFVADPPIDGWRLIRSAGSGIPIVASRGDDTLIDCERAPAGFIVDLIVNPVLAAQREILFLHAASVGIAGGGILLVGPTGSGKTTTALALAARRHAYFGDDMAAVRLATGELIPMRRTASVRPGPRTPALDSHLGTCDWDRAHFDGMPRARVRVTHLFSAASASPLPLRRALFLRRFAAAPAVEPFEPTARTLGGGSPVALNNALWLTWGITPKHRLLQYMLYLRMLSRVRCAWLDVGLPESTADLIETTMGDAWD